MNARPSAVSCPDRDPTAVLVADQNDLPDRSIPTHSIVTLVNFLPPSLRGPTTTVTRVTAGLSGAGVYRVDAAGRSYILKISPEDESREARGRRIEIQSSAAAAGLAPRIVHADPSGRAVISEFVADRVFPALYGDPRTRPGAVALLGQLLRDVHALPIPADATPSDPRAFVDASWGALGGDFRVPTFFTDAVQRILVGATPSVDRPAVLSHNDANPSNLLYDGQRLLLVDWDAAGPNDPYFDLATVSLFLRMDDHACRALLAAYDGAPVSHLPARFAYDRRMVAVMCGATFLKLARQNGHAGAAGSETLESTSSLGEVYQGMRTGSIDIATAAGQWSLGLALVREVAAP